MKIGNLIKTIIFSGAMSAGIGQAHAEEALLVTLKSLDGSIVIVGELQGLEAGYYKVIVEGFGLMRVREALVTCQTQTSDCALLTASS